VLEADAIGMPLNAYRKFYEDLMSRGVRVEALTRITKENLAICREMLGLGLVSELKHVDKVKGNFGISEKEYLAISSGSDQISWLIYSNDEEIVSQNQSVFENLWAVAIPAEIRFSELDEEKIQIATRILRDPYQILEETRRMASESRKYSVSSVSGGLLYARDHIPDKLKELVERKKKGKHEGVRWITNIDRGSMDIATELLELGIEIRHVANVPTESFGFSEKEVGVTISRLDEGRLNSSAMFTTDPMYIEHYSDVFEELWKNSVDARTRINELRQNIEEPRMRIIRNQEQIKLTYLEMINQAKDEILLILPTTNAYRREAVEIGVLDALMEVSSKKGVKVMMLTPDPSERVEIRQYDLAHVQSTVGKNQIEIKTIREATTPNTVTVLVVDRNTSLIIEQQDDSKLDFNRAIGVGTFSTRGSTVKSNIRFFERMWEEVEQREREELLLEKEKRSRREAELLQDILTHDVRNFNQVSRLSAELIAEEISTTKNATLKNLLNDLITAIDGSTELVERAKKLGKVLSESQPALMPISLTETVENAILLIKNGFPDRKIVDVRKIPPASEERAGRHPNQYAGFDNYASVLADDLLYEVFVNLYSNSVRYTSGKEVFLETVIEERQLPGSDPISFWVVTISDKGRGIPDDLKDKLFSRYLKGAKGSGLGMSIVHALVVGRYKGKLQIKNRVKNDPTQGTSIEVWLPKA
jgi:two-component system, OmpR family, sensor histidine kinase VicK